MQHRLLAAPHFDERLLAGEPRARLGELLCGRLALHRLGLNVPVEEERRPADRRHGQDADDDHRRDQDGDPRLSTGALGYRSVCH